MKSAILCLALCVSSCATRYLSAEEDAQYKEACEATGCTVVPNPVWAQILQLIEAARKWQVI